MTKVRLISKYESVLQGVFRTKINFISKTETRLSGYAADVEYTPEITLTESKVIAQACYIFKLMWICGFLANLNLL
jgi:hypothetical protein